MPDNSLRVSKHAKDRAKQRLGFNSKAIKRMANRALVSGHDHNDFTGTFSDYLVNLALKTGQWSTVKVYGEHIYVFRRDEEWQVLITILHVPREFKKILQKRNKS